MNHNGTGVFIKLILFLAVIALFVYVISLIAAVIAAVVGIGGTVWGGGTAVLNYARSFKENMIDSNRVGSAA